VGCCVTTSKEKSSIRSESRACRPIARAPARNDTVKPHSSLGHMPPPPAALHKQSNQQKDSGKLDLPVRQKMLKADL